MSKDRREFDQRCAELRDAKAAVDVFQRTCVKGGFETVTVHVHANGDEDCITRFDLPVGAVNGFLDTCVAGVETAEKVAGVLEALTSSRGRTLEA